MTVFDYAVLAIIGFSVVVSLMRGAVREVISFVGWLVAFYVARTFSALLIPYLPEAIPTDAFKAMVAFIITYLIVLFCVSLIAIIVSNIVKLLGLGWLDRLLGGLVGLLRGLLIVSILVMLGGMTDLPKDSRWVNAMLSPPLEAIVLAVLPWMPTSIAEHVHLGEQVARAKII